MAPASDLFQTAISHHRAGRLEAAENLYRSILRNSPQDADTLHLLGVASHQQGHNSAAVDLIGQAINLRSQFAPYHCNLGVAYRALDRIDEAVNCYREAIHLDSDYADAHYNLGNALKDQRQFEEAVTSYQCALELQPGNAHACNNLGDAYKELGQLDEAIRLHTQAIDLQPDMAEAHFNLGNALKRKDLPDRAADCYRHAIALMPEFVDAHVNLGYLQEDMGRFTDAVDSFERALAINPLSAEAHFNRALAWLRNGEFEKGWPEYEWRRKCKAPLGRPGIPEWQGESLASNSILILAEQGIGDQILFASCVMQAACHAKRCCLECESRLVPLFARAFPGVELISRSSSTSPEQSVPAPCDVQVPLATLPRFFRRQLKTFPPMPAYLFAEPSLLEKWRERMNGLGPGLKVGISWRGGAEANVRRARSTTLDQWRGVLAVPGARFVSLQYGDTQSELDACYRGTGIEISDWEDADPLGDLDEFAAQIAALDLVVSVDNSTVHIAGALGLPVWTLLPFASDWRWLHGREDSVWYPTMRLFRQTAPRNWNDVFKSVVAKLTSRVQENGTRIQV